jgi:D-tyrosyl-tRNA(Tyr) deacylase
VQRVQRAEVQVGGLSLGRIGPGLLVLLGVAQDDRPEDVAYLATKIPDLRIFDDDQGKMNCSLTDSQGAMLVVSQFTLLADCRKGRRPSFVDAALPDKAEAFYLSFCDQVRARGISVATGQFRARMQVSLVNEGPVTIVLDSRDRNR